MKILSIKQVQSIKSCLNEISQVAPSDLPIMFTKEQRLLELSSDLSFAIFSVNVFLNNERDKYKRKRDPEYVMLVRQGRPSGAAIDAEIRFKHSELYDDEKKLDILANVIEYLNHIQLSIDRYIYLLRDKARQR